MIEVLAVIGGVAVVYYVGLGAFIGASVYQVVAEHTGEVVDGIVEGVKAGLTWPYSALWCMRVQARIKDED